MVLNVSDIRYLIEKVLNEMSTKNFNDKIFYHGRNNKRPYNGNGIYLTDSFGYAAGYSDGETLYCFKIPFSENLIFSIRNKKHLQLISKYVQREYIDSVLKSAGSTGEMDWATVDYLINDEYELGEELLGSIGFYGMYLNERPGIKSILVFDQSKIDLVDKIDLTNKENKDKVFNFNKEFSEKHNLL